MLGYFPQVILSGRRINDTMGEFIAGQAVKRLIQGGSGVRGSVATVLGLTFKEDCPDLRNTRVIDIIRDLQGYGIEVQVHDPLADSHEAEEEYGIRLTAEADLKPAEAVLMAVAHKDYIERGWDLIQGLLKNGEGVVVDVKGALDRARQPAGINLWRL